MGSAADYAQAVLPTSMLGNFNNVPLHTYEALKWSVVLHSQTWGNWFHITSVCKALFIFDDCICRTFISPVVWCELYHRHVQNTSQCRLSMWMNPKQTCNEQYSNSTFWAAFDIINFMRGSNAINYCELNARLQTALNCDFWEWLENESKWSFHKLNSARKFNVLKQKQFVTLIFNVILFFKIICY